MVVNPETGRVILDENLHADGYAPSHTQGGDTYIRHSIPSYSYSGSDDVTVLIFALALIGVAIVCSYLGYIELKSIDGGGWETVLYTWGGLVMIPVLMIAGIIFVDTPILGGIWTIVGIIVNGYNLIWGDPVYSMVSVYSLISSVCAALVTWWVLLVEMDY